MLNSTLLELIPSDRVCALGPGNPDGAMRWKPGALTNHFAGQRIVNHDAARCCLSGLWLLFDFLDESHAISQEIETTGGSYWHGIMHRREPDYFNSKYWFRRVGNHAIFPRLLEQSQQLIAAEKPVDSIAVEIAKATSWDPDRFVDWCEQLARGQAKQEMLAMKIAQVEWQLLFEHCYGKAISR